MMIRNLPRLNFWLTLCAGLALSACGKAESGWCAAGRTCLRVAISSDPTSLDPAHTQTDADDAVLGDLMVGLTTLDSAARPIPGVAESWTTSADGLVWTFRLRDAKWSDGAPVTAADFVYSLRRLVDPTTGSEYAYLAYVIAGAEAVNRRHAPLASLGVQALDPRTVRISLAHPAPYLPELLTQAVMAPVPEHVVRRWGEAWVQAGRYVSDGPYVLGDWRLDERVRLTRNPRFYDAAGVCLDEVDYIPTHDAISAERRVGRGELDASAVVAANRIGLLRRRMGGFVRVHGYLDTWYLAFNTRLPGLRDGRVRQALSMVVDRAFITSALLRAGQQPAYRFTPPGTSNYLGPNLREFGELQPDWASWPMAQRQAFARALLQQAGYGPHTPLRLELSSSSSTLQAIPVDIQADWRAIGVETALTSAEAQIFFSNLNTRNFQVALADWSADYDDPTTFLDLYRSGTGAKNYSDYSNPAYDALLDRADAETDVHRRAMILAEAERTLLADTAIAPLFSNVSLNLVSPDLTGWTDNTADKHRKRWMCRARGRSK